MQNLKEKLNSYINPRMKEWEFIDSHKFARLDSSPARQVGSHRSRGFTLIEMLIAMAIFTSSITGLIVVTSSGIANVNFAKNKLTATYLAQEGIEEIRNLRDTFYFFIFTDPQTEWQNTVGVFEIKGCIIFGAQQQLENEFGCNTVLSLTQVPQLSLCSDDQRMDCGNPGINPLRIDQDGFFTPPPQGNLGTAFRRVIKIENIGTTTSTPEIRVTVEVAWQQGTRTRRVSVTENLLGWK